jgi:putative FmdB family regulatory protein
MPIYGYICTDCGHTLDELQKVSDPPLVDCPACGQPTLRRQLSAPRFRLKGQGWYETDFKKENQRNLAGEREADKSSDGKTEKKSDTKAGDAASSPAKSESKVAAKKETPKTDAGAKPA